MDKKDKIDLLKDAIHIKDGAFHRFIRQEYADVMEMLVDAEQGLVPQLQGDARRLRAILSLFDCAKDELVKAERVRPDMSKAF